MNRLPYRWSPLGAVNHYGPPTVGMLIASDHAVWRVVDVRPRPVDMWTDQDRVAVGNGYPEPCVLVLRPAGPGSNPGDTSRDVHLRDGGVIWSMWPTFPTSHYPVCRECQEPIPCRAEAASEYAQAASARMGRYEIPGICPACEEPVTDRQKSVTFEGNLEIPGGPAVTFHTRRGCLWAAVAYEQRWVEVDPGRRRTTLSCPGHITSHGDGTYDCTEFADCRGPAFMHASYSACRCPDCHARGYVDPYPQPSAVRNTGGPG